jgi:hypothetical protein
MVLYKFKQYFSESTDQAFDFVADPGTITRWSGIYRCEGCGKAITSVSGHTLPPQNHHQHSLINGPIRWRLAASHS